MTHENKSRCEIAFIGDDYVAGEIWLTDEEIELVSKVLSTSMWENVNTSGPYVPTIVFERTE